MKTRTVHGLYRPVIPALVSANRSGPERTDRRVNKYGSRRRWRLFLGVFETKDGRRPGTTIPHFGIPRFGRPIGADGPNRNFGPNPGPVPVRRPPPLPYNPTRPIRAGFLAANSAGRSGQSGTNNRVTDGFVFASDHPRVYGTKERAQRTATISITAENPAPPSHVVFVQRPADTCRAATYIMNVYPRRTIRRAAEIGRQFGLHRF